MNYMHSSMNGNTIIFNVELYLSRQMIENIRYSCVSGKLHRSLRPCLNCEEYESLSGIISIVYRTEFILLVASALKHLYQNCSV